MNAFVKKLPAWVCDAIHVKVPRISQDAPSNCCLTNQSAFARFQIRTLRCAMRPNRPAQLSTHSRKKCAHLPGNGAALRASGHRTAMSPPLVQGLRPSWNSEGLASLQIFFRNWIFVAFLLPIDIYDPPAMAVVKQLDAVDSAHERFEILLVMTRFVRTPYVSDVSELFGVPGDFLFEKSVLGKVWFHTGDETIHVQNLRRETIGHSRLGSRN